LPDGALGGLHLLGRPSLQRKVSGTGLAADPGGRANTHGKKGRPMLSSDEVRDHTAKVRLVLGGDNSYPDAFRSRFNPGVLLHDETGALRSHLYASDEWSGLGL